MKALFVHDTFYSQAPDGEVYSFGAFPSSLWQERFLPHFSALTVIGRERPFEAAHTTRAMRSDTPSVEFMLLPNISSLSGLSRRGEVASQIREAAGQADAVIVRGPSEFGMIAAHEVNRAALRQVNLTKVKIPVAVEMSGCAFDHTWHYGSLTGKLYAPVKYLRARRMVNNADSVIYVTEKFLQQRYPTRGAVANASNVEIETPSSDILEKRLNRIESNTPLTFGMIGNHDHGLKGVDTALAAFTRALDHLPPFQFRILGEGPTDQESFARYDAPLTAKNAALSWLDGIDIYLQPSRHEGLPRALIEAMSRACPALGSDAGGIPELLSTENIHKRGDSSALSALLIKSVNKKWQREQAVKNFEKAKNYTRENLLPVREKFWSDFAVRLKNS